MNITQKRILLVEDEWLIGEYLADYLSEAGYDVQGPFPDVNKTLAFLSANIVDIGVLDVSLGKEKSFPIAEMLIQHAVPFLFLSGYVETDLPEAMRNVQLLAKPVQPAQLAAALSEMIAAP